MESSRLSDDLVALCVSDTLTLSLLRQITEAREERQSKKTKSNLNRRKSNKEKKKERIDEITTRLLCNKRVDKSEWGARAHLAFQERRGRDRESQLIDFFNDILNEAVKQHDLEAVKVLKVELDRRVENYCKANDPFKNISK